MHKCTDALHTHKALSEPVRAVQVERRGAPLAGGELETELALRHAPDGRADKEGAGAWKDDGRSAHFEKANGV